MRIKKGSVFIAEVTGTWGKEFFNINKGILWSSPDPGNDNDLKFEKVKYIMRCGNRVYMQRIEVRSMHSFRNYLLVFYLFKYSPCDTDQFAIGSTYVADHFKTLYPLIGPDNVNFDEIKTLLSLSYKLL